MVGKWGIPISPSSTIDLGTWALTTALDVGGRVVALDGTTPRGSVVVELVQPVTNDVVSYTLNDPLPDDQLLLEFRTLSAAFLRSWCTTG